jgi:hypothetical protein
MVSKISTGFVEPWEELESRSWSSSALVAADSWNGDGMAERDASVEERRPDPDEKLVKIFDSEEESEALVVKGLLDSAGIENDLASASLLQDAFPGMGGMIILVREEDAAKARSLIAEYRRPADGSDDDETRG